MPNATLVDETMTRPDFLRGDLTGIAIPAHADALGSAGTAFLTKALRAFGTIGADNQVSRIDRIAPCESGSTGAKLFLSVAYDRPDASLHTDLFVKFSRDFNDALRDRGKHEMESEIGFAALSRLPGFPIDVPKAYFADYHKETQTGVLITEVIRFGVGTIEPQHEKCMDHLIENPLSYYRTILGALARVAAAHKSGLLASEVESLFPLDREAALRADPIPWTEEEMQLRIARYAEFAAQCPLLMPEAVRSAEFWAELEREAPRFLQHELTIKRFLHADENYIALCHWNANIDNAWFRRDGGGKLQCGLMDWGRARQLNLAFAIWGSLNAAPHRLWDDHLDELLSYFVAELHAHGGPLLDVGRLQLYMDLYVATMGLAWLIEAPMRILRYLPEAAEMTGPLDPRLLACERARNQRHVSTLFLSLWEKHDFVKSLERMLAEYGP
jgi:hypothetical protein